MTRKANSFPSECVSNGFEICHPFHTSWYNAKIQQEGLVASGQLQCLPISSEAYLIGNTKSIWPIFCGWLVEQYHQYEIVQKQDTVDSMNEGTAMTERKQDANEAKILSLDKFVQVMKDPFDTFCEQQLTRIVQNHFQHCSCEIFWAHGGKKSCCGETCDTRDRSSKETGDFLVCMQRVAQASGLCWNDDEGTKLCVHPIFGTWIGQRAVVVVRKEEEKKKTPTKAPVPPIQIDCPVPPEEIKKAQRQMQVAIKLSAADGSGVDYGSLRMSETAKSLGKYLHHSVCHGSDWSLLSPSMVAWIELRDCISLGRDRYKYSDPQLLYHYTKDPMILRQELLRCLSAPKS